MKQLWLRLESSFQPEKKVEILKAAEGRCTVALMAPSDVPLAQGLKFKTASKAGNPDIVLLGADEGARSTPAGDYAIQLVVKDRDDEQKAVQLAERGARYLIVNCPNWKVIPLENLIAKTRNRTALLADVSDATEAKVAFQTLELGVDGVVFSPKSPKDLENIAQQLEQIHDSVQLVQAKVTSVKPIGTGVRVCVDTCELMEPGEGMLVGSQSAGLFLIEAEVHKNPHVEPRPFRVNAGPVSSYVLSPGSKTRYLAELKAGDEILLAKRSGVVRPGHVGRVKLERRPMTLIEAEVNGRQFSTIVQNAETVRLVTPESSKAVVDLKPGDGVLIRVEEGGRHFGMLVAEEMVIER